MKRLLLVAYAFPPHAGSGVFRPLRLTRWLPERGWSVTVLSVSARARILKDPELLADVPPGTRVERTASFEPRTPLLALAKVGLRGLASRLEPWFRIPDDQRGWVPFAVRRARAILASDPHHAVITTSAPYSAHLVGSALRRRLGLPWIADFRDEWTSNPWLVASMPTAWHRRLQRRLEAEVLRTADRVVCVSRPWLDNLRAATPDEPEAKFRVLENGFDPRHFDRPAPPHPDRFRVVYTGTFYGPRSPRPFFEAVRRLLADGRIPEADLEVLFVGHTANAPALAEIPAACTRILEHRPHAEALRLLDAAAVLLLVIPREGGPGNHTGKLFNYLAAGRPILTLAPEPNVAADLVRESRSGIVVPPDDPSAIADALAALHREWKAGRSRPDQDRGLVARYGADRQAGDWAALLDGLTA